MELALTRLGFGLRDIRRMSVQEAEAYISLATGKGIPRPGSRRVVSRKNHG